MMDVIIPVGDMPVTAQVTTPGKAIVAAQVSAAGYEQAMQAADRADAAAANADAAAAATANVVADAVKALSNNTGSEAAQINTMAIELVKLSDDYMVLGEALYAPASKMTVSGEAVTPSSATVSGEKVTLK